MKRKIQELYKIFLYYTFFNKQPVYKQLALGRHFVKQLKCWIIFSKQQCIIPDIPKMLPECSEAASQMCS